MEYKRNLNYIMPSIVLLSMSIFGFLILIVILYIEIENFTINKNIYGSSVIFLVLSSITVPGFILNYRYEILNKNRKITFKQNHLEIETDAEIENILYQEVLEVEKHIVSWKGRNPWSDYYYVKLNLKNGKKIYYNCLTETINSENNLLKSKRIKKFTIDNLYPWY
ncbi:hypothetical protein [Flavobacterium polysaccharolyticum]|uniref:PH domain-containing protein n=1 Tax=Flavobacterium polysaccharolyticum TaxID=3133148 RepID=A0ABU9NRI0_9FLAO